MRFMILFLDNDPLAGDVLLPPEVQRFVGYDHERALYVFTSKDTLHSFLKSMELEAGYLAEAAPSQAPMEANKKFTAAQLQESRHRLRVSVFKPEDLQSWLQDVELVDICIAVDPDTDAQQVWDVEMFGMHLEELD